MEAANFIEDSFECIRRMEGVGDYFQRWKAVRQIWAPRLDKGPVSQKEDYTSHNHSNHNVGIYKILSDLLIPANAYDKELTTESLFVLNIAVLLHDIIMTYKPYERAEHSKEAHDFILEHFSAEDFNIRPPEMEAIALVILGHSDIKNENNKDVISTIDLLPAKDSDFINGQLGKINVLLLAALLRLADELDVHTGRVQDYNTRKREIKESSKSHWRKCEILHYPQKNPEDMTVVELVPFAKKILADANIDNDVKLILEVRNKISSELKQLNEKVFRRGFLSSWTIQTVNIKADGEILESIRKLEVKMFNPFSADSDIVIDEKALSIVKHDEPPPSKIVEVIKAEPLSQVAPQQVQTMLTTWVLEKGLLRSGHFKIGDEFRVRDWIDTQGLLDDWKCLDFISNTFSARIATSAERPFIVGIDHHGLLIASLVGVKTGLPFSYVISDRLSSVHIEKEKEIKIPDKQKVIIITDAIITLNTVSSAIKYLTENLDIEIGDVFGIYALFQRTPCSECTTDESPDLWEKVYVLNNSFPAERCHKEDCVFLQNSINLYCNVPQNI